MFPVHPTQIYPGPSSNTTTEVEDFIRIDLLNLSFFDIPSPIIQESENLDWEESAEEVLREYARLWERLSRL